MAIQTHDLRDHPLRPAYLLYQALSTAFVRVPWWILNNIIARTRPRPSWTLKQAVLVRVIAHVQNVMARTDAFDFIADHTRPSIGPGIKQVWLDPAPDTLFSDQLRSWMARGNVEATRIPGYWIDKRGLESVPAGAAPAHGETIGLYLHGGAYILYSASPKDNLANVPKGILKHASSLTRVLSLEYRLSKAAPQTPENGFPAALLDALAGYSYLIHTVCVAPENIVIFGDSAGGNLAHALTRYLVENAGSIANLPPPPGSLLLLSPWSDLSRSLGASAAATPENIKADYVGEATSPLTVYAIKAFLGQHGEAGSLSKYISPASTEPHAEPVSFVGFPRTMIVGGGAEGLIQSIRTLVERMRRDLGGQLAYYEAKDAIHDHLVFPFWEPERTETLKAIAHWIEGKPPYTTKL